MRRIAVINQKGGVGKTTTTANLGAALALQGRRVVLVDMDAQANLSLSLDVEAPAESPSSYTVLLGSHTILQALRPTSVAGLQLVASNIDLSGAELELASAFGREYLMRDALRQWADDVGQSPADYVIFDCPPSLGLLSINALAAAGEVLITLQTEFLALQGMSKLVDVVQLLRRRLNPELVITGILPCLYDSRLKLAREVLGEIRKYFPGQVFQKPVNTSIKLAEAPSYGQTIFEYAPESQGAHDYMNVARAIIAQETRDPALAGLPPFDEKITGPARPTAIVKPAFPKRVAAKPVVTSAPVHAASVKRTVAPTARDTTAVTPAAPATNTAASATPNKLVAPALRPNRKPVNEKRDVRSDASAIPAPAKTPAAPSSVPTIPARRAPATKVPRETKRTTPARADRAQPAARVAKVSTKSPAAIGDTPAARSTTVSSNRTHRTPTSIAEIVPFAKPAKAPPSQSPETPRDSKPSVAEPRAKRSRAHTNAPAAVVSIVPPAPKPVRDARSATASASTSRHASKKPPEVAPAVREEDRAAPTALRSSAPPRALHAEDFPPLPPDAFEILASFGSDA